MDVVVWLRSLGLGKYEAAFRENDIDETVLPSLTHENLKELGVASFGHRVKLLDAIAALRADTNGKTPSVDATTTSSAASAHPEDRAERRLDPKDLREVISAYSLKLRSRPRGFATRRYLSASLTASMPACAHISSWSPVPPLTPIAPICTLSAVMIGNPPGNATIPGTNASPGTAPPFRSFP